MSQKLRNIAQRYAAGQGQQSGWAKQPRDRLGRWVSQHKDTLATVATKSIAAGTGLAGGAVAGPVGAALGQLAGDLAARTAIALGEAAMSDDDQAFHETIMGMGRDLQQAATKAQEALSQVDKNSLEEVMSRDMLGWAVAHAANYGLNQLIPGADLVPGKGGAVAALTVGQLSKLKEVAKKRYGQRRTSPSATPAPA